MIAGFADVLGPDREYFLFDSFEGLPPAREMDGPAALRWQANKQSPGYHDNCKAAADDARTAMRLSAAAHFSLLKGWFGKTIPSFSPPEPIAVLRLDADWYESTLTCLKYLYPHVAPGGVVIIDDYEGMGWLCAGGSRIFVHAGVGRSSANSAVRKRRTLLGEADNNVGICGTR